MNYTIHNLNEDAKVSFRERKDENNIIYVDVDIQFKNAQIPKTVSVNWSVKCIDMYAVWSANIGYARLLGPNWQRSACQSKLANGAPIHEIISFSGKNRIAITVSDAETPLEIATGVCEETAELECRVKFFTMPIASIKEYHATIRIDERDIPYEKALKSADAYLTNECGYASAYIPESAKRPMYSCWYSFHQKLSPDTVVEQCKLAKELGMDSVIVDDGWQTDDNQRGYAYCGDWEVFTGKIPNMKEFVDKVHTCNMKFILWYSVPFIGVHAKAYERFKGMYLYETKRKDGNNWATLDPRYPEVRKYLVDLYVKAKKEWGLDGFKLDFIDSFTITEETKTFDEKWDTISLEKGIDKLLKEVTSALRAIDNEILIEFRQNYFGPAIRKYGNMIRVLDCPNDSFVNKVRGSDMKFILDKTPIHSDMLMWNNDDTVESAAHQVLCSLFYVPQISVLLDKIPKEHYQMLKFWLSYWNEHRDVLLDGDFSATAPEHLYTQIKSEKDGYVIAVAHTDALLQEEKIDKLDYLNATGKEILIVSTKSALEKQYKILDCMGNIVKQGTANFTNGMEVFQVPICGMVQLY